MPTIAESIASYAIIQHLCPLDIAARFWDSEEGRKTQNEVMLLDRTLPEWLADNGVFAAMTDAEIDAFYGWRTPARRSAYDRIKRLMIDTWPA